MKKTIGEIIREKRPEKFPSLREFAKALGIAPSYLSDIETDRRKPSEEVIKAIADKLDLDFNELMGRAGRIHSDASKYMKTNPIAGVLFRKITGLNEEQMKNVLKDVEKQLNESKKDDVV